MPAREDSVLVLVIDDDPDHAAAVASGLEAEDDRLAVETATDGREGLDRLTGNDIDCVVSGYELPDSTGIELLRDVRQSHPDLPFVLFTGRGSEAVASEAIGAGVTDYVRDDGSTGQYEALANRVRDAMAEHRARPEDAPSEQRFRKLIENSSDVLFLIDGNGMIKYVSSAVEAVLGYEPEELVGRNGFDLVHPEDRKATEAAFYDAIEHPDREPSVEFRTEHADGSWRTLHVRGRNRFDDPDIEALVVNARDVTERAEIRRQLESQTAKIQSLHAAANDIVGSRDEEEAYEKTVRAAERILDFEMCGMMIYEDEVLVPKALSAGAPPDGARPMAPDEGTAGKVFQTGEPEITTDVQTDDVAKPADEAYQSAISVPIGDIGVFQATATDAETFDEGDIELAELLLSYTETVIERLRFEQARRDERDRFAALFEHTADGIVSLDLVDGEWLVREVNPAFVETFGYEPDEIVGEPLDDFVTPESEMEEANALNRKAMSGEASELEVRRQTVDGTREFLLRSVPYEAGDGLRGHAVYTDITERKRQRERFQAFIEHSTDIITVLAPDGTYQYQSPSSERILGYRPEELVGEVAFDYVHPDDREALMGTFSEGVENPDVTSTAEYRFRHKDGSWVWLESIGNNQLDNPAVEGLVINSRDITERKERERELQRQNERLDEFASVLSHDLRNPLNVAKGRLALAREEHESGQFDAIERAHDRIEALIDDILTLAREGQRTHEPAPVELADVVEECWETASTGAGTLTVETRRTIRADESRLKRLLENLIRNAVEHGGSDVAVTVGDLDDGFYVADDGPGIPPDQREAVFRSGHSTAPEGTGFGLAIVKEIADAHGWSVRVTDGRDGGARFEITGVEAG